MDRAARPLAIAFSLVALLGACTDSSDGPDPDRVATAAPSTAAPSDTPSPVETLEPTVNCDGFGRPGPRGEITYINDGKLWAATPDGQERCLADVSGMDALLGFGPQPLWNAPADRLIIGDRALSSDLTVSRRLTDKNLERPQWSRPTGTSVVYLTRDGRVIKRSSFGGKATDISFLDRHDDVVYHPAGTHIATTGLDTDGTYGLYLATNVGTDPQLLAIGEAARFITNLEFSQDGRYLYYAARHGPSNWHLHRLTMGDEPTLETLDKGQYDFTYVVSPFDGFRVAWFQSGDCAAGIPGTLKLEGFRTNGIQIPEEFREDDLIPIGWLPRGELVVARRPISCSPAAPGDVYVLSRSTPVRIVEEVHSSASVRVKHPPPPPPPGEEQEVVA